MILLWTSNKRLRKKKKKTVMLALQRKVPYGFPSGSSLTYVTLKKTYFYFTLSAFKQETQEISSQKGWNFVFHLPHKTHKREGFWRLRTFRPPSRRRCPHAADYDSSCQSHTCHRGSPAVLAAAPQSTGQGSNCSRDAGGGGSKLHQSGCFIHGRPSSTFADFSDSLLLSISFEPFAGKKQLWSRPSAPRRHFPGCFCVSHAFKHMFSAKFPLSAQPGSRQGAGFWEGLKGDNSVDLDFRSGCGQKKGNKGPAA